jgi:hypothetical protein
MHWQQFQHELLDLLFFLRQFAGSPNSPLKNPLTPLLSYRRRFKETIGF